MTEWHALYVICEHSPLHMIYQIKLNALSEHSAYIYPSIRVYVCVSPNLQLTFFFQMCGFQGIPWNLLSVLV